MRTRLPLLLLLLVTACSGSTETSLKEEDRGAVATATSSSAAVPDPVASALASARASQAPTGGSAAPSAAASVAPLSTVAPGKPAAAKATAPGTYTLDSSGTITLGSPGKPQDASGTATLTVDPLRGELQHSTLHNEKAGDTEQDLLVRDTGTYIASMSMRSAASAKEFRPSPAVLLVPDPATVGRTWSWAGKSTDGKTTIRSSNRIVRQETITIGGAQVKCVVLTSHLVLSGDFQYTADLTTWWAPEYRLPVKERTVGSGSYNGFPFSTDVTATMRSVRPS